MPSPRNIFVVFIPLGNYEAIVHYEDTIKKRVELERIIPFVERPLATRLKAFFGNRRIPVWGSRNSLANRGKFEKMTPGDDILIVEGNTIKLLGKVALTIVNSVLSKELWKNLKGDSSESWDLIYFIANPVEIALDYDAFKKLVGNSPEFQLRGLTRVSDERLEDFYSRYDDLYSVLLRIRQKESVKIKEYVREERGRYEVPVDPETETDRRISTDHLRMQWKLVRLGLKAGTRVWVPRNDQQKISREYQEAEFEEKFTAGLDVPAPYVENIDVVWKDEFRIDAAFEIENSTAIYSGLLRFSDLKIVAPNSSYPLFVVAPSSRRNEVIAQVRRPTFRKLEFDKTVRYLPYEAVDEVDSFFEKTPSGVKVDVLVSRSEQIA